MLTAASWIPGATSNSRGGGGGGGGGGGVGGIPSIWTLRQVKWSWLGHTHCLSLSHSLMVKSCPLSIGWECRHLPFHWEFCALWRFQPHTAFWQYLWGNRLSPPPAPAALFLPSLLGAGTDTHLTHEQQRTRYHISLTVLLNCTSSMLTVRQGLQCTQALYLQCFPVL